MLIFSCLDAEIQRITGGSTQNAALRRWRPRLRMMWSESQLNDLLSSIRGQQTAMTLLIQLLQMYVLGWTTRGDLPSWNARTTNCSWLTPSRNTLHEIKYTL
jgi:hypothetical protein